MRHIKFEIDEDVFGNEPDHIRNACYYWPFGELLLAFYILAKENKLYWPVTDWNNLDQVKLAMKTTFVKLPPDDKKLIADAYNWFLTVKIDWLEMKNDIEGTPIDTEQWIKAQEDIERYKQ